MTFAQSFRLLFYYVTPFWLIMIAFPNWGMTKKIMGSYILFIPLSGFYIYYILTTISAASFASTFSLELSEYVKLFSQDAGSLGVTIHFVTMDLFVGRWIYWEGQKKNIWTIHSLILCLSFGPVGLLSHIITAYIFDKKNNAEEGEKDTAVS